MDEQSRLQRKKERAEIRAQRRLVVLRERAADIIKELSGGVNHHLYVETRAHKKFGWAQGSVNLIFWKRGEKTHTFCIDWSQSEDDASFEDKARAASISRAP